MKQPEQVVAVEKFSIFQALIFKCAFFVVVWNYIYILGSHFFLLLIILIQFNKMKGKKYTATHSNPYYIH